MRGTSLGKLRFGIEHAYGLLNMNDNLRVTDKQPRIWIVLKLLISCACVRTVYQNFASSGQVFILFNHQGRTS